MVFLILKSFTMETFLYSTVNEAQRKGDLSKVDTLGPYSYALHLILAWAASKRTDIDTERFKNGVVLYRGYGLT